MGTEDLSWQQQYYTYFKHPQFSLLHTHIREQCRHTVTFVQVYLQYK